MTRRDATPKDLTADTAGEIVGVVLAAGSSRRLGRPKQTLALGGRTLLDHVITEVCSASCLDRVVLVTGGAAAEALVSVGPVNAQIVHNDDYGRGCASSLRAGLAAVGDAQAMVMLLGDMVGVNASIINQVVQAWQAAPTWAAVTSYRGKLGHPFVFSADAFDVLQGLHGDKAVWKIVESEPATRFARILVDKVLPRDINTWDDYRAVCADLGVVPQSAVPDSAGTTSHG